MSDRQPTRIIVLGGGFAGIYAVMELERLLGRDPSVEITLVNKDNFFVFTPMLHEVAASDLDPLVWTAGTAPNSSMATCSRSIWSVWSVGDCACVPDAVSGGVFPPTAQHASREGKVLARNLTAEIRGGRKRPFAFKTLGQLAAIGRRTGVANILGVNFSGFIAWWMWRTIYLMKLPRFERKVRVALDWTLDLLFTKDLVQCPAARGMPPALAHEVVAPVVAVRAAS